MWKRCRYEYSTHCVISLHAAMTMELLPGESIFKLKHKAQPTITADVSAIFDARSPQTSVGRVDPMLTRMQLRPPGVTGHVWADRAKWRYLANDNTTAIWIALITPENTSSSVKRGGRVVRALDPEPIGARFDPTSLCAINLSKLCIHDYLGPLYLSSFRGW